MPGKIPDLPTPLRQVDPEKLAFLELPTVRGSGKSVIFPCSHRGLNELESPEEVARATGQLESPEAADAYAR